MPDLPLRRRTDQAPVDDAPLRALVVDDDPNYRTFVATMVRRFGFTVRQCCDGAEAIDAVRDSAYDLLILDCEMPRIDGLELIVAVRAEERYADTYAMMLTGRTDLETKISALSLGFDDFLVKSATDIEIAAKLSAARRIVLRQRRLDAHARELYGLATRDELTGLFNRRFFFGEADRLLAEGVNVNLVFFDLDGFKLINDTWGHLAGDRILRDVGALFLRRTRHEDLICRYGGDEFVMLVLGLEPDEVEVVAERMAADVARMQWTFGSETIHVEATTGCGCSSLLAEPTVAQLLSAGDRDLYKNKWMRKHPHHDLALYQYDDARHERLGTPIEFPAQATEDAKARKESE